MLFRVFTLPFDPFSERFDDTPVRDYLSDKDVLSIDHELLMQEGRAYLAVIVRCRGVRSPAADAAKTGSTRRRDESWRDLLDSKDWPLFERMREWRGERARAAGVPSYIICNNRQLADVVKRRPRTLAALAEIEGFGDAKLKNYGKELLEILQRLEDEGGEAKSATPNDAKKADDGVDAEQQTP
ncbi:MAG: HRDC domain-containing protein [Thiohalocapsa sp. PB-PSB1]|jgi:superfamily II DNA helicase RecQ|nr:MAG: hypothetical protein N838_34175 [Thiohalocapsa sp. PB-PSB1]QQO53443.1 MAG: HRDC domain-containing protein [Thiohalocapsa sp. PB-PSB1]QQO54526.1 MAG: HRDC domain-containing protein [Thiohalocapsa sp. PB-PSB1]